MANIMEDVAKLLGVELEEEFMLEDCKLAYKLSTDGLVYWSNALQIWEHSCATEDLLTGDIEIIKIPKAILDDKEKDYLSSVIKPFRNDVISIKKYNNGYSNYSCIVIEVKPFGIPKEFIDLPSFRSGTMYNGLEANREYTLGELGL